MRVRTDNVKHIKVCALCGTRKEYTLGVTDESCPNCGAIAGSTYTVTDPELGKLRHPSSPVQLFGYSVPSDSPLGTILGGSRG